MTDDEQAVIARVWGAIDAELGETAPYLRAAIGNGADRMIADLIITKFARAYGQKPLVRGHIKSVSDRVDSLARKAQQISAEVSKLANTLKNENAEEIGATAFEAGLLADGVVDGLEGLKQALAELAAKRNVAIPAVRRANPVRRQFAREWLSLLLSLNMDREVLEWSITAAVEEVEGKIGQGEGEWLTELIGDAQSG